VRVVVETMGDIEEAWDREVMDEWDGSRATALADRSDRSYTYLRCEAVFGPSSNIQIQNPTDLPKFPHIHHLHLSLRSNSFVGILKVALNCRKPGSPIQLVFLTKMRQSSKKTGTLF